MDYGGYDDDTQELFTRQSASKAKSRLKISLLLNIALGGSLLAAIIVLAVTGGGGNSEQQLGSFDSHISAKTGKRLVYAVKPENTPADGKYYEPICGKRCRCGESCSLEQELHPENRHCDKHNCAGYAYDGEAPWMVGIQRDDKADFENDNTRTEHTFYCGGSILNRKFILTAGHCLKASTMNAGSSSSVPKVDPKHVRVFIGWSQNNETVAAEIQKKADIFGMQVRDAAEVYIHTSHKGNWDGLYDIGIIKLKSEIYYPMEAFLDDNDSHDTLGRTLARPVCLAGPDYDYQNGARCYAHGFHHERDEPTSGKFQNNQNQQFLSKNLHDVNSCWAKYKSYTNFRTTKDQTADQWVCTDAAHKKMKDIKVNGVTTEVCPKFTCTKTQGSGGPLTCASAVSRRKYVQVGVQAWDLCRDDFPEMYSKVSKYIKWIRDIAGDVQVEGQIEMVDGEVSQLKQKGDYFHLKI